MAKRMGIGWAGGLFRVVFLLCIIAPAASPRHAAGQLRGVTAATCANPLSRAELEAVIEKYRGRSFTFASYGGAMQAALREAYLKPFQERFGISIVEDSGANMAKTQAMVEARNVTWDVVQLGPSTAMRLGPRGIFEELDCRVHDNRHFLDTAVEGLAGKLGGGGGLTWATVLAYREGVKKPTGWGDFWDTKNFPGRRGLYQSPTGNVEFALLAAGYPLQEITYPLNPEQEELAIQKLEELRPHVNVVWTTGSQCPELLIKGELDYCSAWNGRIFDAQKQGAPLRICWECGFSLHIDYYQIPKGAPNKDVAQLFIAWTALPSVNVQLSKYISYGPINKEAIAALPEVVDPRTLKELPSSSDNLPYAVLVNFAYWAESFDRLNERFLKIFQAR
jgi:putative spermidine/putrescine transport system substrate-binding protein